MLDIVSSVLAYQSMLTIVSRDSQQRKAISQAEHNSAAAIKHKQWIQCIRRGSGSGNGAEARCTIYLCTCYSNLTNPNAAPANPKSQTSSGSMDLLVPEVLLWIKSLSRQGRTKRSLGLEIAKHNSAKLSD